METQLQSLSRIFTDKLFRIPDYQRGYAWSKKELTDFWNDLQQIEPGRNHYTGILTLESVPEEKYSRWEGDTWIIESKGYKPFYVVDGQQRLTTAVILIQCILEALGKESRLNFTDKSEIQRRFIFDSKEQGISRSYVFGYEKDNPSYEFLKTRIFKEHSSSNRSEETVYTQNLERAKEFFVRKISAFDIDDLGELYKNVTQHLLFNIFTISDEVDVCVAFETMNNRGKPLSYLELLKNRLIYLSTKFDGPVEDRDALRATINECWKSIYHNLGRNKEQPLDDDGFLVVHYLLYFGKSELEAFAGPGISQMRRMMRPDYASDLLEKRFVAKNIAGATDDKVAVTLEGVNDYVNSLQSAVETWYKMWNPFQSDFVPEVQVWLDKINRIGVDAAYPLILALLQNVRKESELVELLKAIERFQFLRSLRGFSIQHPDFVWLELALDLQDGKTGADRVLKHIHQINEHLTNHGSLQRDMVGLFASIGFSSWPLLKYFMYEYNLHLQQGSKTDRPKIFWPEYIERKSDFVSLEHIFPRSARHPYWTERFGHLSQAERSAYLQSIGNLLPLSTPKNSSLSNRPFPEKVSGARASKNGRGQQTSTVGYRFGSYAENEVAAFEEWTPDSILRRGMVLLDFMEERWGIDLGDEGTKRNILGLKKRRSVKK